MQLPTGSCQIASYGNENVTEIIDYIICDACNKMCPLESLRCNLDTFGLIDQWFCAECEDNGNKITFKCDIIVTPDDKKS